MSSVVVALCKKSKTFRGLMLNAASKRAREALAGILPFLQKKDKILDLGCGVCALMDELKELDFDVTGADIQNLSIYKKHKPVIIKDGKLPFRENQFDVVLIHTVLHHTENPKEILMEAKRVAKRLIVVEETYTSAVQRYLTYAMDSLTNLQFFDHPHTNMRIDEWMDLFEGIGLKVLDISTERFWLFFDSTSFHLEKVTGKVKTSK